jgi:hypothetical protein
MSVRLNFRSKLLILLGLFVLLTIGRRVWFHQGRYSPPDISAVNESQITPHLADHQSFEDVPLTGAGHVLIDLSHANDLDINDLSPLRDRLKARGVTVETFDGLDTFLSNKLHRATALLVIAPTEAFTKWEREAVRDFVADGGKLLLAADPTRMVPSESFFSSPTSAVPLINDVANPFGVIYFDDHLYNVKDNAGNYRHVKLAPTDDEHPLTEGLDEVVFFATHSLRSNGLTLVAGDENTRSPLRSGESNLAAAALTADERVLALGDVTFLTAPHHTIGDNDRFLSHIADWLGADSRQRDELEDFPYMFKQPVDLIQASGEFLDTRLITYTDDLQETFEQADLSLNVHDTVQPGHDALLVGLFADLYDVREYLTRAGVSVYVEETIEDTSFDEEGIGLEEEPTASPSIEIENLGTIGGRGIGLYILDRSDERVALTVLAEDSATAVKAMERLASRNLSDCLQVDTVTVCSTGESQDSLGMDSGGEPSGEETETGRILIIVNDIGAEGTRTSVDEFEQALSDTYEIIFWFTSLDGAPTSSDLSGYDAYILDSGDYAFDVDSSDAISALLSLDNANIFFTGAQVLPMDVEPTYEEVYDLRVANVSHPLAEGFAPDDILELSDSESGVPATVIAASDVEDADIILTRGLESPSPGTPALVAITDEEIEGGTGTRIILGSFAFYRLPEEAQRTLALNAARWLMMSE